MKAKCISSDGNILSEKYHKIGFTGDSKFDIEIDSEYSIYGVCWWRDLLLFLVYDSTCSPNWYPSEFFKVFEDRVPNNWRFTTYNKDEYSVKAVLGYPELLNESHYNGLIEREESALEFFRQIKSEIDLAQLHDPKLRNYPYY